MNNQTFVSFNVSGRNENGTLKRITDEVPLAELGLADEAEPYEVRVNKILQDPALSAEQKQAQIAGIRAKENANDFNARLTAAAAKYINDHGGKVSANDLTVRLEELDGVKTYRIQGQAAWGF